MKTSIKEVAGKKMLVVETGIPKAAYREGITNLSVVVNEKSGDEFTMAINMDAAVGEVSKFGVAVNGVENDNLAIVIPIKGDAKIEDIKKAYGSKLVAAKAGLEKLLASMTKEANDIDSIFEGIED